jgi:hypothetical protein
VQCEIKPLGSVAKSSCSFFFSLQFVNLNVFGVLTAGVLEDSNLVGCERHINWWIFVGVTAVCVASKFGVEQSKKIGLFVLLESDDGDTPTDMA